MSARAQVPTERCPATSQRSGQQCKRYVRGGGVCRAHGGAAPQVAARREARIVEAEARMRGEVVERRNPAESLLAAAQDADEILQRIKSQVRDGVLDPAALLALGDWLDRVARISKLVVDAKLEAREVAQAEHHGELLAGCIRAILERLDLSPAQRALVPVVVPQELRRLAS